MPNIKIFEAPIVGEVENWPQLKLSPRHTKMWGDVRTAILWSQGAFGDILYGMMAQENGDQAWFTDQIPIAATDDTYMYLNPNTFFSLPTIGQMIFACLHEVWHAMFNHCGIFYRYRQIGNITYPDNTSLPYVDKVMQCAADCIINAGLVHCRVGEMIPGVYHKPNLISHEMGLLEAYKILYKKTNGGKTLPQVSQPKSGQGQGQGQGQQNTKDSDGQSPLDTHLRPGQGRGKTANEAISERSQSAWESAVASAVQSMKGRGVGSNGLERLFNQVVEPEVDWKNELRTTFNKIVGKGKETWEHLDPEFIIRGIGAPGRVSYGAGDIISISDSSGSIDDVMLAQFDAEQNEIITDVSPKSFIVGQCDDEIHEWYEVGKGETLSRTVKGGGGTDFRPVFQRIEDEGLCPDVLIYFTDMDGWFPNKPPPYPVIWVSVEKNKTAPFGEVIYVPLKSYR